MKDFTWQHIEFVNGGNPYICKTKKEFKRIQSKYVLEYIREGFWKATFKISYSVVGFPDKNEYATFHRGYSSQGGAMNFIRKALKEKKFECIVLRREEKYLKNNEHLDISSSTAIKKWIIDKSFI